MPTLFYDNILNVHKTLIFQFITSKPTQHMQLKFNTAFEHHFETKDTHHFLKCCEFAQHKTKIVPKKNFLT